ncbi:uncharacterized protein LOC111346255 [Stylophora pistillata]|uniref:uncharacterized protein LOC111346255 n=1 Tax=Stylophora pistillata TaxID=50429 RepID=UPI000C03980B|nr:uncharacterized protein LOC111346255 [Stylophora pistillata]
MTSLTNLTGVDGEELKRLGLQPLYCFDRDGSENLIFMSPNTLLNDSELKYGGFLERSPKKVLGLVTKDILECQDSLLFQVPELTCFHMGYGTKAVNKEGRIAISKEDAEYWLQELNMRFLNGEESIAGQEEEIAEPMDVDTQSIHDDTVYPANSGLCIPQKGSRILHFSILKIFANKKLRRKKKDSLNLRGKIGHNKISDFLLFWTLPYLLNYTQRKVEELGKHLTSKGNEPHSRMKTVKKSSQQIILEACKKTKCKIQPHLMTKLAKYYSEGKLQQEYTLLSLDDGSPIVLVPLQHLVGKKGTLSLKLEDIGHYWKKDGRDRSVEEFLNAFVKSKAIQEDYFKCMKMAKTRLGVDYSIIFPDQDSYALFLMEVRKRDPNVLTVEPQGRGMITPPLGVVKADGQNVTVSFTFFQGTDPTSVSALFRACGAQYCNHFSIIFLYGSTCSKDSDCKLGHLYHVREAEQISFQRGKLVKDKDKDKDKEISFRCGVSKFASYEFPNSFSFFTKQVRKDPNVQRAREDFSVRPETFDPSQHIKVAFATDAKQKSLKNACCNKNKKIKSSNRGMLSNRGIKAANLNGCLFKWIQRHGPKENIGVTLAINNTLGPEDPPEVLRSAVKRVIFLFVIAILQADLQSVYPSKCLEDIEDSMGSEDSTLVASNLLAGQKTLVKAVSGKGVIQSSANDDGDHSDNDVDDDENSDDDNTDDDDDCRDNDDDDEDSDDDTDDNDEEDDDDDNVQFDKEETKKDDRRKTELKEVSSGKGASSSEKNMAELTQDQSVKQGTPSYDELEHLASKLGGVWKKLGRRLGIEEPKLDEVSKLNEELSEKGYKMLRHWKALNGSAATYQILAQALHHELVNRRDLAEEFCYEQQ